MLFQSLTIFSCCERSINWIEFLIMCLTWIKNWCWYEFDILIHLRWKTNWIPWTVVAHVFTTFADLKRVSCWCECSVINPVYVSNFERSATVNLFISAFSSICFNERKKTLILLSSHAFEQMTLFFFNNILAKRFST